MQTHAAGTDTEATYRRVAWRLIPFLIVCYMCAYIDRSNIGIAKLQFTRALHINETMYGLAGGLFYLGYAAFEVPSNLLLRRIGARRTLCRVMIVWSLCSAATALVYAPLHFYVLRFLLGAAEAGFFPGVLLYLSQWVPASRRARLTAGFMSAMALSGMVGGPLSALIFRALDGAGGLAAWRWLFVVEGLPGMVLGLVALWYLTDAPAQAAWLTAAQRALIARDLAADAARSTLAPHASLRAAFADRRFWMLAAMSAALISGIGGVALWMPTVIREAGIRSIAQVGLLSAVPYAAALVVQHWVARRSDRRGERRLHAGVCALAGAAGFALTTLAAGHPFAALACLTVAACGLFGATGPFWSLPAAMLTGRAAAPGIAVITTAGGIAAFAAPLAAGRIASATGSAALVPGFYAVLLAGGAVLLLAGTGPGLAGHRRAFAST